MFLILSLILLRLASGKICDDSYQCSGDKIIDAALCDGFLACSQATIDGSYAECNGYYGCYAAKTIEASVYVDCDGAYGCYNSDKINSATYIQCNGRYSCAFTTMESLTNTNCTGECSCRSSTITAGDHIVCDGKDSCIYSELSATENVYCHGRYSCKNTLITAKNHIYVYGHYGAAYSTISAQMIYGYGADSLYAADLDSTDLRLMNVYAWGYQAGFDAHFVCRSGSTCNIHCAGNGCVGMEFICLFGSTCNVKPSNCTSGGNIDGIDCPIQTVSSSLKDDIKLIENVQLQLKKKMENRELVSLVQQKLNDNEIKLRVKNDSIDATTSSSSNVYLILLTAVVSSLISFSAMHCYLDWKYKNNDYKLLN